MKNYRPIARRGKEEAGVGVKKNKKRLANSHLAKKKFFFLSVNQSASRWQTEQSIVLCYFVILLVVFKCYFFAMEPRFVFMEVAKFEEPVLVDVHQHRVYHKNGDG